MSYDLIITTEGMLGAVPAYEATEGDVVVLEQENYSTGQKVVEKVIHARLDQEDMEAIAKHNAWIVKKVYRLCWEAEDAPVPEAENE